MNGLGYLIWLATYLPIPLAVIAYVVIDLRDVRHRPRLRLVLLIGFLMTYWFTLPRIQALLLHLCCPIP